MLVIGRPRFRPIAAILAEQPVKAAYLDGKIAVLISERIWDFETLREPLGRVRAVRLRRLLRPWP